MNDRQVDGLTVIDEKTRLAVWQSRRSRADSENSADAQRMDEREQIYNGRRSIRPLTPRDTKRDGEANQAAHVNNIVFENVESMISNSLPTPKVTAKHKEDERLAALIEHWLRNEMDRLPFEVMNDMAERTVPIQGGCGWLVEWDNRKSSHNSVGELHVTLLHPKMFCPQPGVTSGIQDMDWFIIKAPCTVGSIRREYGVDMRDEGEEQPEIRGSENVGTADEMLTKYIGYEKNEEGGIDRFVWVNSTVLENIENYQARHQELCVRCRRRKPTPGQIIRNDVLPLPMPRTEEPTELEGAFGSAAQMAEREREIRAGEREADGMLLAALTIESGEAKEPVRYRGGPCPWCGCEEWTDAESEYEEIMLPVKTAMGSEIPGAAFSLNGEGLPVLKPTLVPYYRPDRMPVVLQRNVSVYGKLLGGSDVDVIDDQQNTINRVEKKIIDRLIKAGTRITLPPNNRFSVSPEDGETIYLSDVADLQYIRTFNFQGSIEPEMAYLMMVYEEARRQLGITNSFQGREDKTATSGIAKEFQASQSAGRLESKRVMKAAAYAELFELMFQFQLAYSDEPRSVSYRDHKGDTVYEEFNRYDFLKKDAEGVWYWNTDFLFSVDNNQALESNRTAMWQETRMNLQSGAFGDPARTETLVLFWSKMEELHYPGAGATRKFLEERARQERQAVAAPQPGTMPAAGGIPAGGGLPEITQGESGNMPNPGERREMQ